MSAVAEHVPADGGGGDVEASTAGGVGDGAGDELFELGCCVFGFDGFVGDVDVVGSRPSSSSSSVWP